MTVGLDASQPIWFYDFLSPFSYLLLEQHDKWPGIAFALAPVALADLHRHWGQRYAYGVPAKRVFTYRHALFRAEQLGIPFRMPPAHPFDSTRALLLAIALDSDVQAIREIFRFIWREGATRRRPTISPSCAGAWASRTTTTGSRRTKRSRSCAATPTTRSAWAYSACRRSG